MLREQIWEHIIFNNNSKIEVADFVEELKQKNIDLQKLPTYMARAFDLLSYEVKHQAYSDLENTALLKRPVKDKTTNIILRTFILRLDLGLVEDDEALI